MHIEKHKQEIQTRLVELQGRMRHVSAALEEPVDQAAEPEDDEVLKCISRAGLKEISLLNDALSRINRGTYGICTKCAGDISAARLEAVPFALLCQYCAKAGPQVSL